MQFVFLEENRKLPGNSIVAYGRVELPPHVSKTCVLTGIRIGIISNLVLVAFHPDGS
jgi:hypothetical protein